MADQTDSGVRALAGFFYQILASGAHGFQLLTGPSNNGTDVAFALEQYGQDAASSNDSQKLTLLQYKYSREPATHQIGASELFEILDAFQIAEKCAAIAKGESISFQLISNRRLHPNSRELKDAADKGEPHPLLDNTDKRMDKNGKEKAVRTKPVMAAQRRILKALFINDSFDTDQAEAILRQQAASLGILSHEFDDRLQSLVGFLFDKASSSFRKLTVTKLNEVLGDIPCVRCLTDQSVRRLMLRRIEPFQEYSGARKPLAHRSIVDEITSSFYHALVLVTGDGGVGKTTAVLEAIDRFLAASNAPPPFAVISSASDVDEFWLSREVAEWRNSRDPAYSHEEIGTSLERLEVAVGSVPVVRTASPLLLLILDASDEVEKNHIRRNGIRKLLRFFAEEERTRRNSAASATLVVTCRSLEELDDLNLGCWDQPPLTEAVIQVSEFDHFELHSAVQVGQLPPAIGQRLLEHATDQGALSVGGVPICGMRPVDPVVYEAIRHPAVWNCFREIPSQAAQDAALNGDRNGLDEVAARLVQWFSRKVQRRVSICTQQDVRAILHRVAEGCNEVNQTKRSHWMLPACEIVGEAMASRLWSEAASAGLIVKISPSDWRWKHGFVYEYLRDNDVD